MNNPYEMNVPYLASPGDEDKLTWKALLRKTYSIYRERFWTLFRVGLPAGFLAYLARHLLGPLGRKLLALPTSVPLYWVAYESVKFVRQGAYWIISAMFFAAVASNVIGREYEDRPPLSDGYSAVRARLGAVIGLGLLSWILMFIFGQLLMSGFLWLLMYRRHIYPSGTFMEICFYVTQLLVAGLLSRVALAVPELMDDPKVPLRQAVRNSIRKTENWEPFFIVFLVKSAIWAYAVYWLAERGFHDLWHRTSISATTYDWIVWAVYICIAAVLESPLFIAFSVLYCEKTFMKEGSQVVAAG